MHLNGETAVKIGQVAAISLTNNERYIFSSHTMVNSQYYIGLSLDFSSL